MSADHELCGHGHRLRLTAPLIDGTPVFICQLCKRINTASRWADDAT